MRMPSRKLVRWCRKRLRSNAAYSLVSWEPFQRRSGTIRSRFNLHHLPCSLENGPVAAESLLAFKGAIGASVLEEQRLLRASDHPEAREQVEGFQALRQHFKATLQGKKDRACQLFAEFEKVEVDLARFVSGLGTAWKNPLQVQTAEVQAKIPSFRCSYRADCYHRPVYDGNKKLSMETRYGAAMIRHQGEPSFVRLALAERLMKWAQCFRDQAERRGTDEECRLASRALRVSPGSAGIRHRRCQDARDQPRQPAPFPLL